jgi:hypothetical protein
MKLCFSVKFAGNGFLSRHDVIIVLFSSALGALCVERFVCKKVTGHQFRS